MDLPRTARAPALVEFPAGTELHRIHHRDFAGTAFNPCRGAASRFAPLRGPDGCIPGLYAATSLDGAAYEVLFRGTPNRYSAIPRQRLDDRVASLLAPRRALPLVPLFTPELRGWGLDPARLFAGGETAQAACRALALIAWRDNPGAAGLLWPSVQDSGARALVLFGDRVAESDLELRASRKLSEDETLLEDLMRAGHRAGWRISR